MRSTSLIVFTLIAAAAPVAAQTSQVPRVGTPAISAQASMQQRYAARVPLRTTQLKAVGVHDTTISRLFEIFRSNNLTPVQVDRILVTERDDARRHGPTDNFGAFVQSQLAAGKRGRALSAAIHAEHQRNGHKHDAEKARKERAKEARKAARERAHERERARNEQHDRPMANPGTSRRDN